MAEERVRLGELLVKAKLITPEQLEEVLARQKDDGRRLGTMLAELGIVSEGNVTQILGQQLSVPWVSLHHIDFSRSLLNLVPPDIADKYCAIPIYVKRVRGFGEVLYVALDDPTNEEAVAELAKLTGLHVRPMIAAPSDIRAALRVYYGVGASIAPHGAPPDELGPPTIPPPSGLPDVRHEAARKQSNVSLRLYLPNGASLELVAPRFTGQVVRVSAADLRRAFEDARDGVEGDLHEDVDWQRWFGELLASLCEEKVIGGWRVVEADDEISD